MLTCLKTVFQRITISRTMRLKTKYVRLQVTGQCTTPDKWTSCGLRRRFRRGYGDFGFYDHSDIMTKMVWSQGGHNKRRLLYF